jgi:hypothetical protein
LQVRFLGSVEVVTDQGGAGLIQAAIARVLKARVAHDIQLSSACVLAIDARACRLALLEPENTSVARLDSGGGPMVVEMIQDVFRSRGHRLLVDVRGQRPALCVHQSHEE